MKIRGAYILTLRSVKRLIAVLAAAFAALCTSASAPADLLLASRLSNATQSLLTLKLTLPSDAARAVVPDIVYRECKALYMMRRPQKGALAGLCAATRRQYATRKALTVPMAAAITGLSESTIKRLDRDPRNTNYPGRNATPQILAAWARLYRGSRIAARDVRSANRPSLGHLRS